MWQYIVANSGGAYLAHHEIKGQKWGIRRTKEELAHDKESILARTNNVFKKGFKAANDMTVTKMSDHALKRTQEASRPVTSKQIIDALSNPLNRDSIKIRYDTKGRPSCRFVGKYATVNLNPETGVIPTCWKTGQDTLKRYSKGHKE